MISDCKCLGGLERVMRTGSLGELFSEETILYPDNGGGYVNTYLCQNYRIVHQKSLKSWWQFLIKLICNLYFFNYFGHLVIRINYQINVCPYWEFLYPWNAVSFLTSLYNIPRNIKRNMFWRIRSLTRGCLRCIYITTTYIYNCYFGFFHKI